jgi:hypothetical protein
MKDVITMLIDEADLAFNSWKANNSEVDLQSKWVDIDLNLPPKCQFERLEKESIMVIPMEGKKMKIGRSHFSKFLVDFGGLIWLGRRPLFWWCVNTEGSGP